MAVSLRKVLSYVRNYWNTAGNSSRLQYNVTRRYSIVRGDKKDSQLALMLL